MHHPFCVKLLFPKWLWLNMQKVWSFNFPSFADLLMAEGGEGRRVEEMGTLDFSAQLSSIMYEEQNLIVVGLLFDPKKI